jgi:DNA-binding beta-propeller fold protein YncE
MSTSPTRINDRIERFTADGDFLGTWGSFGSANRQFKFPRGVAVDALGIVYVGDTSNDRFARFTADGDFQEHWGTLGEGPNRFDGPRGIAVDARGHVYIADTGANRIKKYRQP